MNTRPNKERTYLDLGSYNVTCDRCGKKIKNTKARKEWTGLIVCGRCLDERHPQDFVRARVDHMVVPVARPVPTYKYQVRSPTGIYGSLLTPLPSGPENVFDNGNIVNVSIVSGTLPSSTELNVLNGANLIAINGTNGWEILQYVTATLVSGTTYNLTKLLRARYGTYLNMGAPTGARFVYMGQASASVSEWIQTELGLNVLSNLSVATPVAISIQNIITTVGAGTIVVPQGVTNMKVEAIGGGGGCQTSLYYAGGGGGAYARTNKINVIPGNVIYYSVGAGGAINNNGTTSWVNIANGLAPTNSSTGCLADFGKTAIDGTGGGAGLSANSIGDFVRSGGQGGHATWNGGGGGGGAGGPNGVGGAGGSSLPTGGGGGGGGGANGGSAGASSSTDNGGTGGNNYVNTGGGAGGLTGNPGGYGGLGVAGGGGGGAGAATAGNNNGGPGGMGGSDTTFDAFHGCGGGAGGGGAATGAGVDGTGGTGGLYGGGGAASGGFSLSGIGGPGAQGVVVITFYP